MKVVIGITTKNRAAILPKSIASALSQDYLDKIVAVYDDCSTDDTKSLVDVYPDVHWTIARQSKGLMFARNRFLDLADAKYFCSLDDDAWFLSDSALTNAVSYMEENNNVAAVAFDILSPDDHIKHDFNKGISITPVRTNKYIGCGHLLRIDAVKKAGRYLDVPGFYGGEEKDLCIRLMDLGYDIIELKGLYIWHDKTTLSRDIPKQHRSGVCNDLVFMARRTPLILLGPALIAKLFNHFIFAVRYSNASLVRPCLYGFFDFFKFIVKFEIHRRPVNLKTFRAYMRLNKS